MPSLFDIAKSGVQSYRQALAVTGQNIANINTDGYKRREAGLTEVSSGQGGITQIQDGTGLGVRVEDIKRSFDAYLLDRKRNSFSREETATNFLEKISELRSVAEIVDAVAAARQTCGRAETQGASALTVRMRGDLSGSRSKCTKAMVPSNLSGNSSSLLPSNT